MWWNSNRKEAATTPRRHAHHRQEQVGSSGRRNRHSRRRRKGDASLSDGDIHMAETNAGFEVSLPPASPPIEKVNGFRDGRGSSNKKKKDRCGLPVKIRASPRTVTDSSSSAAAAATTTAKSKPRVTVAVPQPNTQPFASVAHVLAERRKVHRQQYSLDKDGGKQEAKWQAEFSARNHRVPLFGAEQDRNVLSFPDAATLLRSRDVSSEMQSIKDEIEYLDAEISFLMQDRVDIENHSLNFSPSALNMHEHDRQRQLFKLSNEWDSHRQLLIHDKSLNYVEKVALRKERGTCLTLSMRNDHLRDALLKLCNFKLTQRGFHKDSYLTIRPRDCREDGAATMIQHVCLLKSNSTQGPCVFASKDRGNPYYSGPLPSGLARRMADANVASDSSQRIHVGKNNHRTTSTSDELHYLSVGPLDSYYAEFRSGECLWAFPDEDLDSLCREWGQVSRIALGPCTTIRDVHGRSFTTASWVVTSRDGRVAWKNVPGRLHEILERRVASEAAPMEVSLGYGGCYFVRFFDGTVDYCLPAHMSQVMEQVAHPDSTRAATSVFLNPELPHDFIIRHPGGIHE